MPATLLVIFFLLYLTYGAARPALLIYMNVPIAATGGLLALLVRGMPFSISAGVGFIALFGIAVLNGVVLLSTVIALPLSVVGMARVTLASRALDTATLLLRSLPTLVILFFFYSGCRSSASCCRPFRWR